MFQILSRLFSDEAKMPIGGLDGQKNSSRLCHIIVLTNGCRGLRSGDVNAVANAKDVLVLGVLEGLLVDVKISGRVGQGQA